MYKLYGNGNFLEEFETEEKAKTGIKQYKEIEKAIYDKSTIKYKIVEEK